MPSQEINITLFASSCNCSSCSSYSSREGCPLGNLRSMFQIVLLMYSERDRCPVGRNSRFIDFYLTTVPIDPNIKDDKRIYVLLTVLNILLVPNWTGACLGIPDSCLLQLS